MPLRHQQSAHNEVSFVGKTPTTHIQFDPYIGRLITGNSNEHYPYI